MYCKAGEHLIEKKTCFHFHLQKQKLLREPPLHLLAMALFPKVTSSEFRLHFIHNCLVQGPVKPPQFEFQHSLNFNYYVLNTFDFCHLDGMFYSDLI